MTPHNFVALACLLGISLASTGSLAEDVSPLKSKKEKLAYSMGVTFVKDFRNMNLDIDYDALVMGIRDAVSGRALLMEEADIHRYMNSYKVELMQKRGTPRKPLTPP
jgi:hypothetical protein